MTKNDGARGGLSGKLPAGPGFLVASVHKTLAAVFADVRIHCDVTHTNQPGVNVVNVCFVASNTNLGTPHAPTFEHVHPLMRDQLEPAITQVVTTDPNHGMILTDDFNPVDYYDAANRENERRAIAMRMKP